MSAGVVFAIVSVIAIALAVFFLFFYRSWRRDRELERPFPDQWQSLLESQVPLYKALPEELKTRLHSHVQLFLAEKEFYGCDGFEIDDKARVTIAGHACLLVLGRNYSDFDEIRSILVYPSAYQVREEEQDGMVVGMSHEVRAGEASSLGRVVLSWEDCERGALSPDSHHNVILHEFAHQLDYLDGTADGAPPLIGDQVDHWQQTMSQAYEHLQRSLSYRNTSWLDPYGATEPAEFFAVLTETFFQQPAHLYERQEEVYLALRSFYRIDPLEFKESPDAL